jgi:nucleotide-binding universal stress UspA family protein
VAGRFQEAESMAATASREISVPSVFDRILCGIDGSPEALEALREAGQFLSPAGTIHLLAAAETSIAVHGGFAAAHLLEEIESSAALAVARAEEQSEATTARVVQGHPVQSLLREIARVAATLIALGSHGSSRAAGIMLGGVATTLLHEAPCSVLIARRAMAPIDVTAPIVAGVDGSTGALLALDAARELGQRLGVSVRVVAATGGKPVDFEGLRSQSNLEWDERKPVEALVDASNAAGLLVVGNRGLHGLLALGSVSERLAHRATCSVLVVRQRR